MAQETKPQCPVPETREDANLLLGELAAVTAEETKKDEQRKAALAKVEERYADDLAELAGKREAMEAALEAFTLASESELDEKRHMALANGKLSLRDTPPKLEIAEDGLDWDGVAEKLHAEGKRRWLRTERRAEKETIKSDFVAGKVTAQELAAFGLAVTSSKVVNIKLSREAISAAAG